MYGCHRFRRAAPAVNNAQIRSLAWSEAKIAAEPFLNLSFESGFCWIGKGSLSGGAAGCPARICHRWFGRKYFQISPRSRNYLARERIPCWSIIPANSGDTRGGGLASFAVPEGPGSSRSSGLGGIRAEESPESRGWAQRQSPHCPGPPVPGSPFAFLANRGEKSLSPRLPCFSWCLERCLCPPSPGQCGQGRTGMPGRGKHRPQAQPCPPDPSGSDRAGPESQEVLKHPKIRAAFAVQKLRDFRTNASPSLRQTRTKSPSAPFVF